MFLIMQNFQKFNYEHIDKILIAMEDSLSDSDCTNSYLLNNLNSIKTACNILMLLDSIQAKYSIAKLRTDALSSIILQ